MALLSLVLATTAVTVSVEATVLERSSHWEGGLIVTETALRIEQVRRGEAPRKLVVRQLGGVIDGVAQVAIDQPELPSGSNVSLELERDRDRGTWRLAAPAEAASGGFVRNTTTTANPDCGGEPLPLAWRSGAVRYVIDDRGLDDVSPEAAQATAQAAFVTWAAIDCSYLDLRYAGTVAAPQAGYQTSGENVNAVTWIGSAWPGSSSTLALTLLTFHCHSGEVLDADILVNDDDFSFRTDHDNGDNGDDIDGGDEGDGVDRDLQNLLTHEVGHLVGFAHSPDSGSTMYATIKPREQQKRDLTEGDVAGMCEGYPVDVGPPGEDAVLPGCAVATPGRRPRAAGGLVAFALVLAGALTRRRRGRGSRRAGC